jgi:hypothetical protein
MEAFEIKPSRVSSLVDGCPFSVILSFVVL